MWGCVSPPSVGMWRTTGHPASIIYIGASQRYVKIGTYFPDLTCLHYMDTVLYNSRYCTYLIPYESTVPTYVHSY